MDEVCKCVAHRLLLHVYVIIHVQVRIHDNLSIEWSDAYFTYAYSRVPAKLVRDWKTLFIKGQPLFEEDEGLREGGEGLSSLSSSSGSKQGDQDKERLLDETDFHEYRVSCHREKRG